MSATRALHTPLPLVCVSADILNWQQPWLAALIAVLVMVDPLKVFWVLTNSTYLGKYVAYIFQ
jgi:hypothetical protein